MLQKANNLKKKENTKTIDVIKWKLNTQLGWINKIVSRLKSIETKIKTPLLTKTSELTNSQRLSGQIVTSNQVDKV